MNLRRPAGRAALLSAILIVGVLAVQGTVGAAVTSGEQPAASLQSVPTTAVDGQWADVPSRTVTLSKQQMALPFGGGSVDQLDVQVALNDSHVGFRLSWTDPTADTSIARPEAFSDAAAVMLRTGDQPPITMGADGKPVDIWYWRASWARSNRSVGGDMYVYPHPDADTRPGRSAGNPLSQPEYETYAQNYYAKSFGSLSMAPTQNVVASGERTDDGWAVAFTRERAPQGQYDAMLNGSKQLYLAFAVWNGSAGEVNGQKSITLQFSTLDTASGELTLPGTPAAGDGGQADDGAPADGAPDGGDRDGLPDIGTDRDVFLILAVGILFIWLTAYIGEWRREQ